MKNNLFKVFSWVLERKKKLHLSVEQRQTTLRRVIRKNQISCPLTGASTDLSVLLFLIFFFIWSSRWNWITVKRKQVWCWRCSLFTFWKFFFLPRLVEKYKNGHLSRTQLTDTRVYHLQTTFLRVTSWWSEKQCSRLEVINGALLGLECFQASCGAVFMQG